MDQNVVVNFIARNTSFIGATKQMTSSIAGVERQLTRLYKVAIGFGVGVTAAYYGASRSSQEFEKNLRNVNSILGVSERNLLKLSNQMLHLATEIPRSAADLSGGLYQVVSSGFTDAASSTMVLEASARAAAAGLTETGTAAMAVSTVLNAYGMSATEASHVSDILFQTVNVGVVTFDQLAQNIGDFIGTARSAGATMEETFAAFSNISIAMGNPARSATALQGIFRALIKPSEDMTLVLTELGYANGTAAIQARGLDGILRDLNGAVKGDSTAMAKLFQDTEGFQGVMALLSQDTAEAAGRIAQFTDRAKVAGVTNRVMAEQAKSVSAQWDQMKSAVGAAAIVFGQVMLPVLSGITRGITFLAKVFVDLPQPIRSTIAVLGLLSSVLVALMGVWLLVRAKIMLFSYAVQIARATMNSFAGDAVKQAGVGLVQFAGKSNVATAAMIKFTGALSGVKTAMIGVARAAPAMITAFLLLQQAADYFANKHYDENINKIRKSIEDFNESGRTSDLVGQLRDVDNTVKAINSSFDASVWDQLHHPFASKTPGGDDIIQASRDLRELDRALAEMVTNGNGDAAAKTVARLTEEWKAAGAQRGAIEDVFSKYTKAVEDSDQATKGAVASAYDAAQAEAILDQVLGRGANAASKLDIMLRGLTSTQQALAKSVSGEAGGVDSVVNRILKRRNEVAKSEKQAAKGKSPAERELEYAKALMGVERASRRVEDAQRDLNEARSKDWGKEISKAEEAVTDAYQGTRDAEYQLIQAQKDLDEARKDPTARTIEEAEIELQRSLMAQEAAVTATRHAQEKLAEAQDHGTPDELAESQRELTESLFAQKEAAWRVQDAEKALRELREQPDKASIIEEKERAVAAAREAVSDANEAVIDAEADLAETRVRADEQPKVISDAEFALKEALMGVKEATEEVAKTQQEEAVEGQEATREQIDLTMISLAEFHEQLKKDITAHEEWGKNLQTVAEKYGANAAAALAKLGIDGANLTAQMAAAVGTNAETMGKDLEKWALYGSEAFNAAIIANLGKGAENAKTFSKQAAEAIAEELGIGLEAAVKLLEEYGYKVQGFANSTLVERGGTYTLISPDSKASPRFQAEGTEDHRAQIAPPGAWRVWAEPETGGEAYIPLSRNKRQRSTHILSKVAQNFGFGLTPMAAGGIVPPTIEDFVAAGAKQKAAAFPGARAALAMAIKMGAFGPSFTGGLVELGHQFEGFGFAVGEHPAFGGVHGVHTPGSYHYMGRAIDVNWRHGPEKPKLDDLFMWIRANVEGVKELLWQVPGHFDHLHLAMANGGIFKKFDNGGYLDPGFTMAYNGTGQPERVLTADQAAGGTIITLARGAVMVEVRAEAGVDQSRLAALVGEKVETGVRTAVRELQREIRRN